MTSTQEAKKIVQSLLDKGVKHFCTDWDLTALKIHTSETILRPPYAVDMDSSDWKTCTEMDVSKNVRPGREPCLAHFANPALFKEVITECLAQGIKVYIMSFGFRALICKYVEALFGKDQTIFTDANVFTPSNFGGYTDFCSMGNKLAMLAKVVVADKATVALFDDGESIIEGAKEAGYIHSVWVPEDHQPGLSGVEKYFN